MPQGARARLGTIRYHSVGYTLAIAVSPDNRSIACLGNRGTITLLDVATGKRLRHFAGGRARGRCLAFSPDGRRLASFTEGGIVIWDVRTGQIASRLRSAQALSCLAFARNGQALTAAGESGSVRQWDLATGKELRCFEGIPAVAGAIALSADGRTLALAGGWGMIRLLEVATGKELCVFRGYETSIWSLAFSPDGRLLASGSSDTTILLWDNAQLAARHQSAGNGAR